MHGRTSTNIIIGIIVILVIIGGIWWWSSMAQNSAGTNASGQTDSDEQVAVTGAVHNFGKELQFVSLAGDASTTANQIEQYYASSVATELLTQWEQNPSSAPGRATSSPWPDHIDINSMHKNDDDTYTVEGTVAEITSVEATNGGVADSYPVSMTLENRNGTWLITSFEKNAAE